MDALFTNQFSDGIKRCHQHDECRDDTSYKSGENFATFLEDANEVLADRGKPAKLFFLLDVLKSFFELIYGNSAAASIARRGGGRLCKL